MVIRVIASLAIGYLLGCFSTGIFVSKRIASVDIRTKGSGNAGATNMLRTLGWVPSLLTFAGDALKAILACLIGSLLLKGYGAWEAGLGARLAGIACVLGHNWPVFFGFKGGKGVASSFGVLLFVSPAIAACALALFLPIAALTKTISVASISAGLLNVVLTFVFFKGDWAYIACGLAITALLLICHRSNIRRLLTRSENKLDFEKISEISKSPKGGKGA